MRLPSPLHELHDDRISAAGVGVYLKRDDLVDPTIPGNKWRKLKYNIEEARRQERSTILTFGGAHSNHVRATAAAGERFGFDTIGVIRGEEHLPLNSTLRSATAHGMRLTYLDRGAYRRKSEPEVIERLGEEFGDFHLIPEGGANSFGVRGCTEIVDEIDIAYDVICCSCGTAATLAGIALALPPQRRALGFSALKGGDFLRHEVVRMQCELAGHTTANWEINLDHHFGGYARKKPALLDFIDDFEGRHGIALDWVYEAKMMYGLIALAEGRAFPRGTRVVAVIAGPPETETETETSD